MDDDENTGYGKPPKHSRFVKGKSGNPKGRPKRIKNLKTELLEVLREMVTINDRGRTRKVTKLRALLESVFAKPFKGDSRTGINLLNWIGRNVNLNSDLNPEPFNPNHEFGDLFKEPTPAEQWEWIYKLHEAVKEVRGLPPAVRALLDEDEEERKDN